MAISCLCWRWISAVIQHYWSLGVQIKTSRWVWAREDERVLGEGGKWGAQRWRGPKLGKRMVWQVLNPHNAESV